MTNRGLARLIAMVGPDAALGRSSEVREKSNVACTTPGNQEYVTRNPRWIVNCGERPYRVAKELRDARGAIGCGVIQLELLKPARGNIQPFSSWRARAPVGGDLAQERRHLRHDAGEPFQRVFGCGDGLRRRESAAVLRERVQRGELGRNRRQGRL
jgi:hypothetical protein